MSRVILASRIKIAKKEMHPYRLSSYNGDANAPKKGG